MLKWQVFIVISALFLQSSDPGQQQFRIENRILVTLSLFGNRPCIELTSAEHGIVDSTVEELTVSAIKSPQLRGAKIELRAGEHIHNHDIVIVMDILRLAGVYQVSFSEESCDAS